MHRTFSNRFTLPSMVFAVASAVFMDNALALTGIIFGARDLGNRFVISSLDLTDQGLAAELLTGTKPAGERIRGLFVMPDGRLAIARASVVRDAKQDRFTIEILAETQDGLSQQLANTIRIKEVPTTETGATQVATSVTQSNIGDTQSLTTLLGHYTDTPSYSLGTIDIATGDVTRLPVELTEQARFANLTRCPDGITYATNLKVQGGGTRLVRLDVALGRFIDVAQLRLEGNSLRDDLKSMTCMPSGELLALGDPTYRGVNSLFHVDPLTGNLTFIRVFDVDLITAR